MPEEIEIVKARLEAIEEKLELFFSSTSPVSEVAGEPAADEIITGAE